MGLHHHRVARDHLHSRVSKLPVRMMRHPGVTLRCCQNTSPTQAHSLRPRWSHCDVAKTPRRLKYTRCGPAVIPVPPLQSIISTNLLRLIPFQPHRTHSAQSDQFQCRFPTAEMTHVVCTHTRMEKIPKSETPDSSNQARKSSRRR